MKSIANNLASMLVRSANLFPYHPAVSVGQKIVRNYTDLLQRTRRLAAHLTDRMEAGSRVMINSQNCPEYLETLFACWWAGMIAVPVNAKLHAKEVEDIAGRAAVSVQFCGTRTGFGIVLGGKAYEDIATANIQTQPPRPVQSYDPAWLFFTSGTTGKPKGAILTHGNLWAMCASFLQDVIAVDPGDSMVHAAPLSHGSGLYALPHVLKAANNVVLESGHFDAGETEHLLHHWGNSCTFGPPTIMNRILNAREIACWDDEHRLKALIYGGGPLYRQDLDRAWKVTNGQVAQIYGQGESPCTITGISPAMYGRAFPAGDEALLKSVGPVQTGVEIKIEEGEVLVRGPQVMHGYWKDPIATDKALAFGWLHTGDLGQIDERGLLTLTGRKHDTIISGGSNVYPREVEEVLLRHPNVKEAAVLGRPHPDLGEQIIAAIVPKADHQISMYEELDALCLESIARFKRPRSYLFLEALPITPYGKTDYAALREMAK